MSDRRIFGNYEIVGRNESGREIQRTTVENTGTITISDIRANATMEGLDELVIIPMSVEVRNNGKTEVKVESEGYDD